MKNSRFANEFTIIQRRFQAKYAANFVTMLGLKLCLSIAANIYHVLVAKIRIALL